MAEMAEKSCACPEKRFGYMRSVILFSVAHSDFMLLQRKLQQGIEIKKEQLEECFRRVVESKTDLEKYQKELNYPVGVSYLEGVVRFEYKNEEIIMKNGVLVKGMPSSVIGFSKQWFDAFHDEETGDFDSYKYEVAYVLYYLAKDLL